MLQANYSFSYPKSALNPNGDPLPTQQLFHQSPKKFRLLAGAFGTGKTTSICIEVQKDIAMPNNLILMGRKDMQEFKSTTLQELLDITPPALIENHNKDLNLITYINGSKIKYENLDITKGAFDKIKSHNLGAVYIDQLEEIDEKLFTGIVGRLRRQNSRRCFVGSSNPEGHDWTWRRWKQLPFEEYVAYFRLDKTMVMKTLAIIRKRSEDWQYDKRRLYKDLPFAEEVCKTLNEKYKYDLFSATTLENIYLPSDYVEGLLSMPKKFVDRYVYCSWDDYSGLVYSEFNPDKHLINPFEPDSNFRVHIILDYGYKNPTAVLFAAVTQSKQIFIYDEIYNTEKRISENTSEIKRRCPDFRNAVKRADPSIWRTERDGKSVADEYGYNGIFFQPADNSVAQGIDKVNELFSMGMIHVSRKCRNFIEEIGEYKYKELKPGLDKDESEEPRKKKDHLMDCLRYLVNYTHPPVPKKERQPGYKIETEGRGALSMADF